MKILAAPIIHARTKNVDFRTKLLVRPEDFTDSKSENVRGYILSSTAFFELAGSEGRRVVLCDDKHVITGVSIKIASLSEVCGRKSKYCYVEDGKRSNYAFIGLVVPKTEIRQAFDVPLTLLFDLYEKYMEQRWDEADIPANYEPVKAAYEQFDLPLSRMVSDLEVEKLPPQKCVIDLKRDQTEAIAARVLWEMGRNSAFQKAFCSDMPSAASILKSKFEIVTSENAAVIRQQLLKKEMEENANEPELDKSNALLELLRLRPVDALKDRLRKNTTKESAEKIIRIGKWVIALIGTAAVVMMSKDSNDRDHSEK